MDGAGAASKNDGSKNERADAVHKVKQQAVTTGRSRGNDVEITAGLNDGARVIMQGAGFLNDGDSVRVVASVNNPGKASNQP